MKKLLLLAALLSPVWSHATTIDITYDFDSATEIADWDIRSGTATVSSGKLSLSGFSGIARLPFEFDRSLGDITVDARVRIDWQAAGDFNVWAFRDPTDLSETNPFYNFGYFPTGSDNQDDWIVTQGGDQEVFNTTQLSHQSFGDVTSILRSDGGLESYINGGLILDINDGRQTAGSIDLRSWGLVEIESLRIRGTLQSVPGPAGFGVFALSLFLVSAFRRRLIHNS